MILTRLLSAALAAALLTSCSRAANDARDEPASAQPASAAATASGGAERKYLLERIDDAAVVQLYADGFESLPLREKTLIWHLYLAAIAGRDIYYDQRYAHNLAMRDIIEAVLRFPSGVEEHALRDIRRYAKLFWINTGPYNNLTARKFVLDLDREAFTRVVKTAAANGARLPLTALVDQFYADLQAIGAGRQDTSSLIRRLEP